MEDLYQVLGVPQTASGNAIKAAWRNLAKQFHPDQNPGDKVAADRFAAVNAAYTILGDPDRRRTYDEAVAAGGTTTSRGRALLETLGREVGSRVWGSVCREVPELGQIADAKNKWELTQGVFALANKIIQGTK
jgi:curved DNA-binding protein CbpA